MARMKKVYVAGCYRGRDSWEVESNIRIAEEVAYEIAKRGMIPVCPHSMYRFFDRTLNDDYWIEATLELQKDCDATFVAGRRDRWLKSEGTMGEIQEADHVGMPVFTEYEKIDSWNNSWKKGEEE